MLNLDVVFEELNNHFHEANAEGENATYQFNISGEGGGIWAFEVKDGNSVIIKGGVNNPDVEVSLPIQAWQAIRDNDINSQDAFNSGLLQIKGDINLAVKMTNMFTIVEPDSEENKNLMIPEESSDKYVFVIMPFTQTKLRTKRDLDEFFETEVKETIENHNFENRYFVSRSGSEFNITDQIIKNLNRADIVICDLSGENGNPNVMYELGVRLSISRKPVILIREQEDSSKNKYIFDIQGFYAHPFNPKRYRDLREHLVKKVSGFETGSEIFESPVLLALRGESTLIRTDDERFVISVLKTILKSLNGLLLSCARYSYQYIYEQCNGTEIEIKDNISSVDQLIGLLIELEDRDKNNHINLSQFKYLPNPSTTLETFTTDRGLENLIVPAFLERVENWVNEYYLEFLSSNSFWISCSMRDIVIFLRETQLISRSINQLIRIINSEEKDKKTHYQDLHELLKQSRFSSRE